MTKDNVKAKRGDRVWEIGVTLNGFYMPTLSVVGSKKNPVINEDKCWKSVELCQSECDLRNQNKTT